MNEANRYDPLTPEEREAELDAQNPGTRYPQDDWQRSHTPRNLTPDEVETLLGALENLIAITSVVKPTRAEQDNALTFRMSADNWETFVEHRVMAVRVWNKSIAIIDGGDDQ